VEVKTYQATGLLTILEGEATEEKLDQELKNLVQSKWDYKVKRMDKQKFLVVFPDKSFLENFAKLKCFEMPLFGLKGTLECSNVDPKTSLVLQTVWIRISNVPSPAREMDIVKEIGSLVVEPLVVDEVSLIRAGPVRFQGRCRNPTAIKGDLEFFFNGTRVLLGFEVEGKYGGSKGGKGGPPGQGKPNGSFDKDKDKPFRGDNSKKPLSKFDRIRKIDKEMDFSQDGSMEEQMEKVEGRELGSKRNKGVLVTPIAAFHLEIGLVQGAKILDLSDCPKEHMVASNQNLMMTAGDVMESSDNVTKRKST
jgi:hypothetical protein